MSSCGLYNKYERPDNIDTKGIIRDAVSNTDTLAVNDTTSFGNLPWQSVFTDPQLQALIQQALEKNVDLQNAALNVKMIESTLLISKLAFLPSVAINPQGTLSSWDGSKTSKTYQLPVAASWIVTGVANLYYTLLMLDRQKEILDEMEKITKETWDMMALQMQYGRARSTSVQSAEASYYSVKSQAADMNRQIRETENSLCLLLNQPGQQIKRSSLDAQQLPTEFSTGVGIQLLNNRPDVHAAEMKLAACFHDVQTARSRFYPSIKISGAATYTNSAGAGIINPGKWLLSAVGSLTQPIFANGQLIAGLKVAKAQQEQAFNSWQNAVFKAGNEVGNALVSYNTYSEKSEYDAKNIDLYTKNVEDTRQLYMSSGTTYLEVISAQANLLNAQISKVTDDFYKMQAVVSLYSALGGGTK